MYTDMYDTHNSFGTSVVMYYPNDGAFPYKLVFRMVLYTMFSPLTWPVAFVCSLKQLYSAC